MGHVLQDQLSCLFDNLFLDSRYDGPWFKVPNTLKLLGCVPFELGYTPPRSQRVGA